MAISKRTRYEVLRRDNFTCRYCGAKAPDVVLHVDHVIPVALGGSDKSGNLVAACADCNSGKTSTSPDAATVEDVTKDALRWAAAIQEAARRAAELSADDEAYLARFYDIWHGCTPVFDKPFPISSNWRATVLNYRRAGLTNLGLVECMRAAMEKPGIPAESRYPYFCGVARNRVQALAEAAAQLIDDGEV